MADATDLMALIRRIEDAGYSWAVGRERGEGYTAAVKRHPANYIGDEIHGPSCECGDTPAEALAAAFRGKG